VTAVERSGWYFPDVGFEPRHLDYFRKVVGSLPGADRVRAALGTGSRAAGLAHRRSDLDLILVFATEADRSAYSDEGVPADLRSFGDLALDVTAITLADLERFRRGAASREEASRDVHRPSFMPGFFNQWSLLTRTVIGEVVQAAPDARALLAGLGRDDLRRALMTHSALCHGTLVDDVRGSLECGDLATALTAAEGGVRMAVEGALAGCGDLYVGDKFLRRRMARHPFLRDVLDEHGSWIFGQPPGPFDPEEVRRTVRRRLELAGHLLGHALLAAWERPVDTLPPFAPSGSGPVRSPFHAPVRWAGGFGLMAGTEIVHRLTPRAAQVWALLDGRSTGEAAAGFARLREAGTAEAGSFVRGCVRDWRGLGLVEDAGA
jgi:hypothetical protein